MRHPFPKAEFDEIFGKVPRLTVEILIQDDKGVLLAKRSVPPSLGKWYLPGGTVRFGESLTDAVIRIAKDELDVTVKPGKVLGYVEYPAQLASGYSGWPVGIVFEAVITDGTVKGNEQGRKVEYFKSAPENTHPDQINFLNKNVFDRYVKN